MTTPAPHAAHDPAPLAAPVAADVRRAQEARLLEAWRIPTGWRYWSAVNNTVVGLWYIAATLVFFVFGGVLALLMRLQLAQPGQHLLSADLYNQVFTLHGSVMMFLFAIPIFEAMSIMFLPQMIGARELPFPRLSAFGFWAFAIGGTFLCASLFFDAAPRGGWFMYPPLTSRYQPDIGADIWLLGFSFIEVAAIAAAVELIVGVLKCRAPGMRLNLIPLYAWYVLVAAFMLLFAFPPLIAGTMLLELERAFGWPFFDPAGGGDPLLWQHLFWIFGHPEVYIIFLPSIAIVAMIVPTATQRPLAGYSWIVLAAVGTGFLSFGLWVHHMFTTGLPAMTLALFSAASTAVAIPTGVQFFCFIATFVLARRVVRSVPMLYVLGGLATFVIGGLTGVMLAMAPFNLQAHDTFFVVAHLHTVLIGGAVFPLIAGLYYFYPLVNGKMLSERLGRWAFWPVFVGFNLTFMPMHVAGLLGMPRRVFTYQAGVGLEVWNLMSTAGAFVLAGGLAIIAWDLIRPKKRDPMSPRNPWNAGTLEWLQEMPGQPWGVRTIPEIDSRYPLWEQPNFLRDYDEGRFYLPDAEELRREMIVTTTVDAAPAQCLRIPGPSYITLVAAIFVGGMFIFATYKWYALAGVSALAGLATILVWLWTGTSQIPEKATKDVGLGVTLPLYVSGRDAVGWWAMCITMLAVFAAFVSLVFGYFFYWTLRDDFPTPGAGPGVFWPVTGALATAGAWVFTLVAKHANGRDAGPTFYVALVAAVLLSLAGVGALLAGPWLTGLHPVGDVYAATVWLLVIWGAVHVALGIVMQLYCAARRAAGRMTATHDIDITNVALYWHFVVVTVGITVAVIAGFPLVSR